MTDYDAWRRGGYSCVPGDAGNGGARESEFSVLIRVSAENDGVSKGCENGERFDLTVRASPVFHIRVDPRRAAGLLAFSEKKRLSA